MFTKEYSPLKRKFRSLLIRIINKIENNGNINFQTNGEKLFVDNLFDRFQKGSDEKITVLDVGANVGNYTQMLIDRKLTADKKIFVHAFEPTKACYNDLVKRFQKNDNVAVVKKAVSDKKDIVKIFYDTEKSGLASLYQRDLDAISISMDKYEEIEAIKLEDYIEENKIEHIHFMKIDIEGHELAAFKGLGKYLNNKFIDYIQFEYGGANIDSRTILKDYYELLEENGFALAKVMPNGLVIRKYHPVMDNFCYSNFVAVSQEILK